MLDLHYYCHIGQGVYVDAEVFPYPENPKTWTSKLHRQKDKNRIKSYISKAETLNLKGFTQDNENAGVEQ
jgi:hypothetical protein